MVLQTAAQTISRVPWEQFLPLIVLVITPILAIGAYSQPSKLASKALWLITMVLENLGLGITWSWLYGHGKKTAKSVLSGGESKEPKKRHVRRTDQLAAVRAEGSEGYYPGLVNISGTYCFLNSSLQAMASLSYLQPYIKAIHARAEQLDVPTPIIDSFLDIITDLNTPNTYSKALRPIGIIYALSTPSEGYQRSALFSSREHQDAQELFQLLSETMKNESKAVDDEASRDRGLSNFRREASLQLLATKGSVFDGLTANRRSCVECGYTEAVMHFAFDNLQLTVPHMASCQLEDCLADYTRLELLNDCICRKCSLIATHEKLSIEAERLSEAVSKSESTVVSSSKKKRAREARKLEARVKAALEEGRIEDDIKGVTLEKVFSRCSTKQSMIARPPAILVLHLNRSIHFGMSGVKNTCRVLFPEYLDLTRFTTSGQLSTLPSAPISSTFHPSHDSEPLNVSDSGQFSSRQYTPQVMYRLTSVVCHYGTHSYGHYVAFRRKPRPVSDGLRRWDHPMLRCPFDCLCEKCLMYGPIRDEHEEGKVSSSRWLRISDDSVDEVGLERVLAECSGTYMLYYERVMMAMTTKTRRSRPDLPSPSSVKGSGTILSSNSMPSLLDGNSQYHVDTDLDEGPDIKLSPGPLGSSSRSSEETIKPLRVHSGHGHLPPVVKSDNDLIQPEDGASEQQKNASEWLDARIVRSVDAVRHTVHNLSSSSINLKFVTRPNKCHTPIEGTWQTETESQFMSAKTKGKKGGWTNGDAHAQHLLSQSMPDLSTRKATSLLSDSLASQKSTSPSSSPMRSQLPSSHQVTRSSSSSRLEGQMTPFPESLKA